MSNILAKTKTYLVGHMQYASGRDWRSHVEEELEKLKTRIQLYQIILRTAS